LNALPFGILADPIDPSTSQINLQATEDPDAIRLLTYVITVVKEATFSGGTQLRESGRGTRRRQP